jgi:hypothetical protein
MIVSWYQCTCGFVAEATPRFGDSIASVNHLHRATRLDGTSSIVRMDEILDPALECDVACSVGSGDEHRPLSGAGTQPFRPRDTGTFGPQRRSA